MAEFIDKILDFEKYYHPDTGGWGNLDGGTGLEQNEAHIELEVGRMLYGFILLTQPRIVLETGTHKGYSTCMIAQALKNIGNDGRVISSDPWLTDHLWEGTELAPIITWVNLRSQDLAVLPNLQRLSFELLVLDSDHGYKTIMEELILFDKLLIPGGHIFFHDVLFFNGVGAAVEQLKHNPRYEVIVLNSPRTHEPARKTHRCPGIAIARKIYDGAPPLIYESIYDDWTSGHSAKVPHIRRFEPEPPDYLDYDPRMRVPPRNGEKWR